jgi:hypothetical protein
MRHAQDMKNPWRALLCWREEDLAHSGEGTVEANRRWTDDWEKKKSTPEENGAKTEQHTKDQKKSIGRWIQAVNPERINTNH